MSNVMRHFGEANYEFTTIARGHMRDDVWVDVKDGRLELRVDYYQPAPEEEWNVDRWDEEARIFDAPASREGFYDAWRCARALVAGRNVRLLDGQVIAGRPITHHPSPITVPEAQQ